MAQLTIEQKRQLFHDGYTILKNAVPQKLVDAAQTRIETARPGEHLIRASDLTDLLNKSSVTDFSHLSG